VEARAQLQQGRDLAIQHHAPYGRSQHARDDFEHGALARAVISDDANNLSPIDGQVHVFQCQELHKLQTALQRADGVFLKGADALLGNAVLHADILKQHNRFARGSSRRRVCVNVRRGKHIHPILR